MCFLSISYTRFRVEYVLGFLDLKKNFIGNNYKLLFQEIIFLFFYKKKTEERQRKIWENVLKNVFEQNVRCTTKNNL